MNPLGIATSGLSFSVGFKLKDGAWTNPIVFWIGKRGGRQIEVNSIDAVNVVLAEAFGGAKQQPDVKDEDKAIRWARILLEVPFVVRGPSGLSLAFQDQAIASHIIMRLEKAGLEKKVGTLLLGLSREYVVEKDEGADRWSATWYEVDKLGGVERVTIRGLLKPVVVSSILKESIYPAGTVNPKLMISDNLSYRD